MGAATRPEDNCIAEEMWLGNDPHKYANEPDYRTYPATDALEQQGIVWLTNLKFEYPGYITGIAAEIMMREPNAQLAMQQLSGPRYPGHGQQGLARWGCDMGCERHCHSPLNKVEHVNVKRILIVLIVQLEQR